MLCWRIFINFEIYVNWFAPELHGTWMWESLYYIGKSTLISRKSVKERSKINTCFTSTIDKQPELDTWQHDSHSLLLRPLQAWDCWSWKCQFYLFYRIFGDFTKLPDAMFHPFTSGRGFSLSVAQLMGSDVEDKAEIRWFTKSGTKFPISTDPGILKFSAVERTTGLNFHSFLWAFKWNYYLAVYGFPLTAAFIFSSCCFCRLFRPIHHGIHPTALLSLESLEKAQNLPRSQIALHFLLLEVDGMNICFAIIRHYIKLRL